MDILLITIDCWRRDLAHLVKEQLTNVNGLTLTDTHFSPAPYTAGSFKAIFAGEYPLNGGSVFEIPEGSQTLAEALKERGYHTIGIHSNPQLCEPSFRRGFDVFADVKDLKSGEAPLTRVLRSRWAYALSARLRKHRIRLTIAHSGAEEVTEVASYQINRHRTGPLFVWVHYMDAHFPYRGKGIGLLRRRRLHRQFLEKRIDRAGAQSLRCLYEHALVRVGKQINTLFKKFHRGRTSCALIITSDHGEGFFEHGFTNHPASLYDELLRVPLLSNVPLPLQQKQISSHQDLYRDIVELAGASPGREQSDVPDGGVLMEVLDTFVGNDNRYPSIGYRTPSTKLILSEQGAVQYDLLADPAEQHPLPVDRENPDIKKLLAYLEKRYDQFIASRGQDRGGEKPPEDPQVRQRLRDLGYL